MEKSNFKSICYFIAGILFSFTIASCSSADNKTAEKTDPATTSEKTAVADVKTGPQTIKGEVLDMSCYMDHDALGQSHKKCAQGCLEKGLPAGILGEDGQVYLLLEDHDLADVYKTAIQHAAEKVTISGTVINKNGVQSIIVKEVKI